jgi:aromatic-amino-acid transaminase
MTASLFAAVEMAPRDPILGLTESFNADTRSTKVNLGVGVYFDDNGKIPLLAAVKAAEKGAPGSDAAARLPADRRSSRLQPGGPETALRRAIRPLLEAGRVLTIEALGGTGALKVGADYLRRLLPAATVYISDPSWENHRALFEYAGFEVDSYPYYDAVSRGVDFAAMKAA